MPLDYNSKHTFYTISLVLLSTATLYSVLSYSLLLFVNENISVAAPSTMQVEVLSEVPTPDFASLEQAKHVQSSFDAAIAKQQKVAQDKQKRIDIAYNYLASRGSPMAPYAKVIVAAADRCGGNYKSLIAIAYVESGLGKLPYKKYNPYGYLNGVQYSSWSSALDKLSCQISKQYLSKYGTNFTAMGKIYASNPKWGDKVANIYYSI